MGEFQIFFRESAYEDLKHLPDKLSLRAWELREQKDPMKTGGDKAAERDGSLMAAEQK